MLVTTPTSDTEGSGYANNDGSGGDDLEDDEDVIS